MADWQYKNSLPTRQGWKMTRPSHAPVEANATAKLTAQNGNVQYLWLHQIDTSFQNGGQFAQSARKREWYARNLTGVQLSLTGRCANQGDYHDLVEFIRNTQQHSLDWQTKSQSTNGTLKDMADTGTVELRIAKTERHSDYYVKGHIPQIDRTSTQFVFAPEYKFNFLIAFSYIGLFETTSANANAAVQRRKLASWMDVFDKLKVTSWQDDSPQVGPKTAPGPKGTTGQRPT